MPLTVGPGSISVAITIDANHPHSVRSLLINGPAILIGVTLVAATVFVTYRYADRLSRMIGETGMNVLLRLSAFILLCIGVQIAWNGASTLLRTSRSGPLSAFLHFGAMPLSESSLSAVSFFARCASPMPRNTFGALVN